jgi:hypothetical protein
METKKMDEYLKKATLDTCANKIFSARKYTNWEDPDEFFDSGFGILPFIKWAILEKKRIEERGGKVTIWEHPKNKRVCLTLDHELIFVNNDSPHYGLKKIDAAPW